MFTAKILVMSDNSSKLKLKQLVDEKDKFIRSAVICKAISVGVQNDLNQTPTVNSSK